MLLIDANLLIYAYNASAVQHSAARRWLESAMAGTEPVGLAWVVILAFLRLSTSRHVPARPLTMDEATHIVDAWLEAPVVELVGPTPRHWTVFKEQLKAGQSRGGLATDAHLAALAIEYGATLCSADRDFARFPGLRFVNPLAR